jgi:hypothetical protein
MNSKSYITGEENKDGFVVGTRPINAFGGIRWQYIICNRNYTSNGLSALSYPTMSEAFAEGTKDINSRKK